MLVREEHTPDHMVILPDHVHNLWSLDEVQGLSCEQKLTWNSSRVATCLRCKRDLAPATGNLVVRGLHSSRSPRLENRVFPVAHPRRGAPVWKVGIVAERTT